SYIRLAKEIIDHQAPASGYITSSVGDFSSGPEDVPAETISEAESLADGRPGAQPYQASSDATEVEHAAAEMSITTVEGQSLPDVNQAGSALAEFPTRDASAHGEAAPAPVPENVHTQPAEVAAEDLCSPQPGIVQSGTVEEIPKPAGEHEMDK